MKFSNMVEILQERNEGYLILISCGNFYIAIGRDAILLNKILDFKLTCMKEGICKAGFPKSAIEKYEKILKRKRYSFIVYDFDNKKGKIEEIYRNEGTLKNEIKEKKRDCYICKNELDGYLEKEDKYTKALIELHKSNSSKNIFGGKIEGK